MRGLLGTIARCGASCVIAVGVPTQAPLHIHLDADLSINTEAGRAVELGIRTGLDELGWQLGGQPVKLVVHDHRGSVPRSRRNLKNIVSDDRTLVLFGGMHSPPLLDRRQWLCDRQVLTVVPWAAATPITRVQASGENGKNWLFRLSVDDSKAGEVLVSHAADRGLKTPLLLLEDTGWGRANEETIGRALASRDLRAHRVQWLKWGSAESVIADLLSTARKRGADSIFLVANAPEAARIVSTMGTLPEEDRLPILSHWGIAGMDIGESVGLDRLGVVDVTVLQTRYPFAAVLGDPFGKPVFERAVRLSGGWLKQPRDLRAPNGFVHAYDLVRILAVAADQASLTGDAVRDRRVLRDALENLQVPARGLMGSYPRPFGPWSPDHPDAHEALGVKDYVMARYNELGDLVVPPQLVPTPGK